MEGGVRERKGGPHRRDSLHTQQSRIFNAQVQLVYKQLVAIYIH